MDDLFLISSAAFTKELAIAAAGVFGEVAENLPHNLFLSVEHNICHCLFSRKEYICTQVLKSEEQRVEEFRMSIFCFK